MHIFGNPDHHMKQVLKLYQKYPLLGSPPETAFFERCKNGGKKWMRQGWKTGLQNESVKGWIGVRKPEMRGFRRKGVKNWDSHAQEYTRRATNIEFRCSQLQILPTPNATNFKCCRLQIYQAAIENWATKNGASQIQNWSRLTSKSGSKCGAQISQNAKAPKSKFFANYQAGLGLVLHRLSWGRYQPLNKPLCRNWLSLTGSGVSTWFSPKSGDVYEPKTQVYPLLISLII